MNRVVIIGGGPGGYESALVAAQLGADVTVVDTDGLGGSAVLTDCVPSKTLIATAEVMTEVSDAAELGVLLHDHEGDPASGVRVDLARVNERVLAAGRRPVRRHRPPAREGGRPRRPRPRPARRSRGRRRHPRGRLRGAARGGRRTARDRRRAPRAPDRAARRRADPDLGAGLRPHRDAVEPDRGRLRCHRRRVRLGVPRARDRGHPGLLARPGAARRGRRRGHGARGRVDPPRHERALQVPDGVGVPLRRHRDRHAHRRPHRRGLALHPGARLGAEHRRPRPRGGRRAASTRAGSSPSTRCRVRRPAASTPPATAPAC